ncbi:MAG: carboxylesterase family protein, partial [Candidatus Thorarchaeota archaeon]
LMELLKLKERDIDGLCKIPAEKILEAQEEYQIKNPNDIAPFRPVIDGETLPIHPLKAFQNGDCKNIELMMGTNLDEFKLFSAMNTNFDMMVQAAGENVLPGYFATLGINNIKSKEIIDIYKKEREGRYSNE